MAESRNLPRRLAAVWLVQKNKSSQNCAAHKADFLQVTSDLYAGMPFTDVSALRPPLRTGTSQLLHIVLFVQLISEHQDTLNG